MPYKLGLAQIVRTDEDVMAVVRDFCAQAREQGVDLLVFPESLMTPFGLAADAFIASAQPLDGTFASRLDAMAREFNLWIVYTMNESSEGSPPYNTAVLVDPSGHRQTAYRKLHLFDSSTHTESRKMSAGSAPATVIETPFAKIGMGICYDLRFPEYARSLTLSGCDLLAFPAAWVDGPNKAMQWETLLRARAIENEIFVAGVSRGNDEFLGRSYVFAPDGTMLASSTEKQHELVVADIDETVMEKAREQIPVLAHRRPDLYEKLTEREDRTREARRS